MPTDRLTRNAPEVGQAAVGVVLKPPIAALRQLAGPIIAASGLHFMTEGSAPVYAAQR